MKRLMTMAAALIAAVCMNAGALMAQVTNLELNDSYFEDNTNITETSWNKKNITFAALSDDKSTRVAIKINTDHVAGTYTQADCPEYECSITNTTTYDQFIPTTATYVVAQDGDKVTLTADMSNESGNYHIVINYVNQPVNINIGGISIYDYSKPTYNISAYGTDYNISMSITSTAEDGSLVDGEYTVGEYSNISINKFYAYPYFAADSKVTVTNTTSWNGDPCVKITGEVMGTNGVKYILNLTSGLTDPDVKLELTDAAAMVTPDFRENGRWILEGKNENVLVHMQMAKEDYAGTYDMKRYAFGYDNYITIGGEQMEITQALVTVEDLGESIKATGWVMGELNGKLYYVDLNLTGAKGVEPAAEGDATTDIEQAFQEWTITSDWMWGGWVLDATNAEGYSLHLISGTMWDSGDLPVGTYTVTNDWEANLRITPSTAMEGGEPGPLRYAAGQTPNGSYLADGQGNFWFIYKGTVTVAYDESGLNLQCYCLNTAGNTVKVSVSAAATGIDTIMSNNNSKVMKFIEGGKVIIAKDGKTYGINGAEGK